MRPAYGASVDEEEAPLRRQWPGLLVGLLVLAVVVAGTVAVLVGR